MLLVVQFAGSQKLNLDFLLYEGLQPLTLGTVQRLTADIMKKKKKKKGKIFSPCDENS